MVLAPGAGAGRDQAGLVCVDEHVTARGVTVERIDFPYRLAGRRAPDRPAVLVAAVTAAVTTLAGRLDVASDRVVAGGRSMGGRMASMAAADGLALAGLVLISYPLHPPGRPERLRTEHFPRLRAPCLFVSGTRDAFGRPDELTAAVEAIPGPVSLRWIDGGDHGLRGRDGEVADAVTAWLDDL